MAPLTSSRVKRLEEYCTTYAAVVPEGVALDDALRPEFWAHVSMRLRQHDVVRMIPEDGTYFAEAVVVSAGRGWVRVKLLRKTDLTDEGETQEDAFAVPVWKGPHKKWCVVRQSDSQVLKDCLATKDDAAREAASYALVAA